MKEFTFIRQTLVKMWTNETFSVEAENYEDAKRIFLAAIENGDEHLFSHDNFENLYDTAEEVCFELLNENEERIDQ